jgi:hypothetical protein
MEMIKASFVPHPVEMSSSAINSIREVEMYDQDENANRVHKRTTSANRKMIYLEKPCGVARSLRQGMARSEEQSRSPLLMQFEE